MTEGGGAVKPSQWDYKYSEIFFLLPKGAVVKTEQAVKQSTGANLGRGRASARTGYTELRKGHRQSILFSIQLNQKHMEIEYSIQ